MSVRLRELSVVSIAVVLLTVLLTWPIAPRLATAGRIGDADGQFSVWNVAWVAHALSTDPASLFDANIFYPHRKTLAFSDANVVAGVIALPVWLMTHNALAATNWVILCSFVLAALSAYLLVRHLTGSRGAAAVAAVLYGFSPYALAHLSEIQLLMTFGPPLAMLMLHRFVDRPSVSRALWLSAALVIQALACSYYGIFGGIAVGFGFLWLGGVSGRLRDPSYWLLGGLSAVVAGVLVAPFVLPYLNVRDEGFGRSLEDARLFSTHWRAYFASAVWVHRWMLPLLGHWKEVLFPKFITLGLAAFAVVMGVRRRAPGNVVRRSTIGFYVALAAAALWASLGPTAGLYTLLYHTVPMVDFLRAPARFGVIVVLGLAVLAGVGLAAIERRLSPGRRRLVLALACGIAIVESFAAPLQLTKAPREATAYELLKNLPWGPVAEYPFYAERATDYQQAEYMLLSTSHWKPLINGYSDFTPGEYLRRLPAIASFPSPAGFHALQRSGARYVLIHWENYPEAEWPRLLLDTYKLKPDLRPILKDGNVSLFEIVSPKWAALGGN